MKQAKSSLAKSYREIEHINSVINSRNKYYSRLTSDHLLNHYNSHDRILTNPSPDIQTRNMYKDNETARTK